MKVYVALVETTKLPLVQLSKTNPSLGVATMVAVGDVQVGWVTIATVPMLSLAEATWTLSNITSIKLEKLFHSEAYELVLPQGIYTGMLFGTS